MKVKLSVRNEKTVRNDQVTINVTLMHEDSDQSSCVKAVSNASKDMMEWAKNEIKGTYQLDVHPVNSGIRWNEVRKYDDKKQTDVKSHEMAGYYCNEMIKLVLPLRSECWTPLSEVWHAMMETGKQYGVSVSLHPAYTMSDSLKEEMKGKLRRELKEHALRLAKELTGDENAEYRVKKIEYGGVVRNENMKAMRYDAETGLGGLDQLEEVNLEAIDSLITYENATSATLSECGQFVIAVK